MIRFHGGPITPADVAKKVWLAKHACVSFYRPNQDAEAFELAQSVMLDNGAFSAWQSGEPITDWSNYAEWVKQWRRHPSFAFALIPDVITGTEEDNASLIAWWREAVGFSGCVPVWHLHESLERLKYLARAWETVAIGSSGAYATINTPEWRGRMNAAMRAVCDPEGRPQVKLHGLRMMNPTVFSVYPFASVDSTNVARNHNRGKHTYPRIGQTMEALILAERMEVHAAAARWIPTETLDEVQENMELVG